MTIAVTNNWQLHIPLATRQIIGLERPGLVTIQAKSGQLIIKPQKSKLLSLAGSLNHLYQKNPLDLAKIRDRIDYD